MLIDVFYFHNGERWYGARFKVPKHGIPLQVFGATAAELDINLERVLNFEFPNEVFTIRKVEDPAKIDA